MNKSLARVASDALDDHSPLVLMRHPNGTWRAKLSTYDSYACRVTFDWRAETFEELGAILTSFGVKLV